MQLMLYTMFRLALQEGRKDKNSRMEKVFNYVGVVAGLAEKTKLNQSLVYENLRKISFAAKTRWDFVSNQVRVVSEGFDVISKHKAVRKKIPKDKIPQADDIKDFADELKYFVRKRKVF